MILKISVQVYYWEAYKSLLSARWVGRKDQLAATQSVCISDEVMDVAQLEHQH